MGIYDRDYLRQDGYGGRARGGPGPLKAMRFWSVNTWLIVICVAVFMIDALLPARYVLYETRFLPGAEQIDNAALFEGPRVPSRQVPGLAKSRIHVGVPDGPVVGEAEYRRMQLLQSFLHFSTARGLAYLDPVWGLRGFEFWRLLGFQFLHVNMGHLFFNMLGLYFFGSLVESALGSKRYLAFYLLCGICGALLYMLLNVGGIAVSAMMAKPTVIPGLLFNAPYTPLMGASAGVFGVLMAGAYLRPNDTVLLFFILPMRLATLAYGLVVFALVTVFTQGNNAGGEAAHIGGAIAGFYFIRHPHHLHGFFDIIGRADPTSHHYRGKRKAGPGVTDAGEVDRILDKIRRKGMASLSRSERRALGQASERFKR
jgi:membrane associated rhomboid family serine protease